jgi:hypothetical protein
MLDGDLTKTCHTGNLFNSLVAGRLLKMCWDPWFVRIIWSHVGDNAGTAWWSWNSHDLVLTLRNIMQWLDDWLLLLLLN